MEKQAYKIDWLSLTLTVTDDCLGDALALLDFCNYDLNEFEKEDKVRNFYNSILTISNYVNIYYNDPDKERVPGASDTVNLVWTGQGTVDLYNRIDGDWLELFSFLRKIDAKVTRLDIAMDDYEGLLNLSTIAYKLEHGHYWSKKRSFNVIRSVGKNENAQGFTINIGNLRMKASKDGYVGYRLYDKLQQYKEENQLIPDYAKDCWLRYELVLVRDRAEKAIDELLSGKTVDEVYKGIVKNMITFIKPTKNNQNKVYKDIKKWEKCDWWESFVACNDEIRFNNSERDVKLHPMLKWFRQSVVPTLKNLERICEYHGIDFYEVLESEIIIRDYPKKSERLYNELSRPEKSSEVRDEIERFIKNNYEREEKPK